MSKKHLSVKSDRDWQALCSEFNVCKRRLRSKEEGLLILSKELDTIRKERDEYKLMAEQLREKYHGQKRKYEERERALGLWSPDNDHVAERRSQSLAQLLCEARAQNKKLQFEAEELRQKMSEAHGDIKLLRESIARQRVGDEGVGARHFPAHEREELVKQIEELREQATILERDLLGKVDDEQEILTEKEYYRLRAERINQELNYILGGDEKRIVDIDALVMENQYLKERLNQCQEEKDLANQQLTKYKNALDRRRGKGTLKLGGHRTGGVIISQKQVQQLLAEGKGTGIPATPSSVADLQSLASALLETISDKTLALNHQRNTNKILGKRVAELEKKLKTLEVAGFWNLPPGALRGKTLSSLKAECEEMQAGIKALTPQQASGDSEDNTTPISSTHTSPLHKANSTSDGESFLSLGELDLVSPHEDESSISEVGDARYSSTPELNGKNLSAAEVDDFLDQRESEAVASPVEVTEVDRLDKLEEEKHDKVLEKDEFVVEEEDQVDESDKDETVITKHSEVDTTDARTDDILDIDDNFNLDIETADITANDVDDNENTDMNGLTEDLFNGLKDKLSSTKSSKGINDLKNGDQVADDTSPLLDQEEQVSAPSPDVQV